MGKNEPFLCGDETGALVADYGTWSVKCGFAGEDLPKIEVIAEVGTLKDAMEDTNGSNYVCGINRLTALQNKVELANPCTIEDSQLFYDFDMFDSNITFCFKDKLSSNLEKHPFMLY